MFFLMFQWNAYAQESYVLLVKSDDPSIEGTTLVKRDSSVLRDDLERKVLALQQENYLLANLDRLIFVNDTVFATIYSGPKFESVRIRNAAELPKDLALGRVSRGKLNLSGLENVKDKFITSRASRGYPFARVWLDSIQGSERSISGHLLFNSGPYITFDSLQLTNKIVDMKYLSKWLKINYDEPFSQLSISEIELKLKNLDFLKLKRLPSTKFQLGKALVTLDLEANKVNQFDGIVGVVPAENNGGARITGEINLVLKNLFKRGRSLMFNWIKLRERSQQLKASYIHPLILQSPLTLEVGYDQLKEDTLFSNRKLDFAISYPIKPNLNFLFSYSNTNGNNLRSNNAENGDFDVNYYGLGVRWNTLDDIIFPRKGNEFSFDGRVGAKKSSIPGGGRLSSNQYLFNGYFNKYFDLNERKILYWGVESGWIYNSQTLFLNDLFRVGGLRSIRGFNENFFFASKYVVTNMELRFQFELQSYFFLFIDQAFLEYEINTGALSDNPTGLGAGFRLKMSAGIFNVIYGLGRTSNEGFSFDSSKIHFGYTGNF